MKKSTTLLTVVLFYTVTSFSQPQFWNEQVSGVTVQLTSVSPNQNDVWVCGYSGTVLRTTNGGLNWLNVSGNGIPGNVLLVNIWGIDANTAVVSGYLGSDTWVWRTSNAGANWVQVFSQPGGFINGIVFRRFISNRGFMQGDPVGGRWSLWKTTNGGINWDSTGLYLPQAGSEAGWNNSIFISSQNFYNFASIDSNIWFGTNNSRIYCSTNFGLNWSVQSTAPEVNSYALFFSNSGFLENGGLTGGSTLLKTTTGGLNWTIQSAPGTGSFGGFVLYPQPTNDFFGPNWYVRNDLNIYKGFNLSNFSVEYTAPSGNYRHMSVGRNISHIWAVRSNGGITKCNCFISGIEQTGNEIPDKFSLFQNYPNPFNPMTKIKFQMPKSGFAVVTVFDALGKEVQVLVNQQLSAGTYEVDFPASAGGDDSNLPSGVYYYRLDVNTPRSDRSEQPSREGNFSQTKKMVLIK